MGTRKVKHNEMASKHCTLYALGSSFAHDALRPFAETDIAGRLQRLSLWMIIKWSTRRVYFSYHWQGFPGEDRVTHSGYWVGVPRMLDAHLGLGRGWGWESREDIQNFLIENGLRVERILKESKESDGDVVSDETKEAVLTHLRMTAIEELE